MTGPDSQALNRRGFLQVGATATAAALAMSTTGRADDPPASKTTLPTRKLGNTGVEVTILEPGYFRTDFLTPDSLALPDKSTAAYSAIPEMT